MRDRKLELEHFLSQHGVNICLLIETFLNPEQSFRLANYVCHHTDRPTAGGGTAILVRRGIVHQSVPVPGLTRLETTAIQVTLAGRPVVALASYISPSRPLIGADLSICFGGGFPKVMVGDVNAKHVDWNSRLSTRREKLVRDYADENSCLIFGSESPTKNPYDPSVTHDVLGIFMTKNLTFPVYLNPFSVLSLDPLPVVIDTACRSSYHHPQDRPDFRRSDSANFQNNLEELFLFDLELHNEMAIGTCVENFSGAVLKALAASNPKRRPRDDQRLSISAGIQDEIRLTTGCGGSGRSPGLTL